MKTLFKLVSVIIIISVSSCTPETQVVKKDGQIIQIEDTKGIKKSDSITSDGDGGGDHDNSED